MISREAAGADYYEQRVFAKQNTREAREARMLPLRQSVVPLSYLTMPTVEQTGDTNELIEPFYVLFLIPNLFQCA